jgi:hypothetical protein
MTTSLTRLAAALGVAFGGLVWSAAAAGAADSDGTDRNGPDRNGPDRSGPTYNYDIAHADDLDDGVI